MHFFSSPLYCMAAPSELAVLLTTPDSRGFMCRSKWKWPVTFPVALANSQTARYWTASTMSCRSLSLNFSYLMLFPKCGHLLTKRPGACVSAHVFFSFFKFFFLSQLKMSTVCCTKQPSMVFWIPLGTAEVIGQPVTQSVGNVYFMLLTECGEFFAGVYWATRGLRGRVGVVQATAIGQNTVTCVLMWRCSCCFLRPPLYRAPSSVQRAAKTHIFFKRALPVIPPVFLQLAIDSIT